MEGDPTDFGRHSRSDMRMSTETPAQTTADGKVATAALSAAIQEIARELAEPGSSRNFAPGDDRHGRPGSSPPSRQPGKPSAEQP